MAPLLLNVCLVNPRLTCLNGSSTKCRICRKLDDGNYLSSRNPLPCLLSRLKLVALYLMIHRELLVNYQTPTARRHVVGFPIHREPPLEFHNSVGLTFPPRAGVLVPKTLLTQSPMEENPPPALSAILQTSLTSHFDRLVFTILIAWFLQSLRRLGCFASQYIRTVPSFLRVGLFRLWSLPYPSYSILYGGKPSYKVERFGIGQPPTLNKPGFHPTPTKYGVGIPAEQAEAFKVIL